jgi:hypothetical protein
MGEGFWFKSKQHHATAYGCFLLVFVWVISLSQPRLACNQAGMTAAVVNQAATLRFNQ